MITVENLKKTQSFINDFLNGDNLTKVIIILAQSLMVILIILILNLKLDIN